MVVAADHRASSPEVTDAGGYFRLTTPALALRVYKEPLRFGLYRPDDRTPDRRGEASASPPTTATAPPSTSPEARASSSSAAACRTAASPTGTRRSTSPSATTGTTAGCPNSVPFYLSHRRLRRPPQHLRPRRLPLHDTGPDQPPGTALRRLLLRRRPEARHRPLHRTDRPAAHAAHLRPGDGRRRLLLPQRPPRRAPHARRAARRRRVRASTRSRSGWMLVNDGYGCGYEDPRPGGRRPATTGNMQLGLWTSTGLGGHAAEVRAGARVRKLDIGWVGPGYRASPSTPATRPTRGSSDNSDGRGFVWTARRVGRLAALRRALERRPGGQLGVHPLADPDLRRRHDVGPGLHHRRRRRDLRRQRPRPTSGPAVEDVPARRHGHERLVRHRQAAVARRRALHVDQPRATSSCGNGSCRTCTPTPPWRTAPASARSARWCSSTPTTRRPGGGGEVRVPLRRGVPRRARLPATGPSGTASTCPPGRGPTTGRASVHRGPVTPPRLSRAARPPPAVRQGRVDHPDVAGGHAVVADARPQPTRPRRLPRRARASFTLYEDDGVTRGYARGEYAEQTFTVAASDREVRLTIGAASGSLRGPARRPPLSDSSPRTAPPEAVTADAAEVSWHYDPDLGGVTVVTTSPIVSTSDATITIDV